MHIANHPHHHHQQATLARPSPVVAGSGANMKKPSFLIKDILASSNSRTADLVESNPARSTSPSAVSDCSLSLPPYHLYPAFQACFGTPHGASFCLPRPGFSLNMDAILEQNERSFSLPIPLPVYVRTRSPLGDGFSKPKKCRRSRTVFTELQLMGLETKFENQKYLSTPDRIQLAETLGLTQIQVKTWYQNRRMKWKKQVLLKGGTEPPTKPKGRPKKNCFLYPDKFSDAQPVIEEIDLREATNYNES